MKKLFLVLLLISVITIVSACSDNQIMNTVETTTTQIEETTTTSEEDKYAYITEEGLYYISNHAKFDTRYWDQMNELSKVYNDPRQFLYDMDEYVESVSNYLGIEDTWHENYESRYTDFQIIFKPTQAMSKVQKGYLSIKINEKLIGLGLPPYVHEITHILLPYYSSNSLSEGLAAYMQDMFGKNISLHNYGVNVHSLSKEFLNEVDIIEVIGTEGINMVIYYGSNRYIYYLFSYSYSKYLIDQYGIDKFVDIYLANDLYNDYIEVYGKNFTTLKSEWLNFLDTIEPHALTYEELYNQVVKNNE